MFTQGLRERHLADEDTEVQLVMGQDQPFKPPLLCCVCLAEAPFPFKEKTAGPLSQLLLGGLGAHMERRGRYHFLLGSSLLAAADKSMT
jgi:hypothetical protein